MGRGSASDLPVRQRLGAALPAMFLDDEFVQRFCDGLDVVLAPVPNALDSFAALLDPRLTPSDFLAWLGAWVGVETPVGLPLPRRRALVGRATAVHRSRGTVGGLVDVVEMYTGCRPEVVEGGAAAGSATPGAPLPGRRSDLVVIRIPMPRPDDREVRRLDAVIVASIPAHLRHRVEFTAPAPVDVAVDVAVVASGVDGS